MTRLTFRNKVLPALRSLAFDCTFDISKFQAFRQNLVDCVFTGLQACSQLSDIDVGNYGERCISFLRHQIDLGNLKILRLRSIREWPDTVRPSLISFIESPSFMGLNLLCCNLALDTDLATCFVDHFLRSKLREDSQIDGRPSFALEWLHDVRRESVYHYVPNDFITWTDYQITYCLLAANNLQRTGIYIRCY
uniref:F-box domain-containing protein n=1 Tax=Steinernema glaseri TaxID=37863 RepID=A0A1I7Y413_9BILA